jgi:hypothetical protein
MVTEAFAELWASGWDEQVSMSKRFELGLLSNRGSKGMSHPIRLAIATSLGIMALLLAGVGLLLLHDEAAARTVQNDPANATQEVVRPGAVSAHPVTVAAAQAQAARRQAQLVRIVAIGALLFGVLALVAVIVSRGSGLPQPSDSWVVSGRNPEAPGTGAGWGA